MKQKQTTGYIIDMVVRSAETGKTIDKFSNYPLLKAIAILEIKYSLKEKLEAEQRRLQAKWAKEAGQLRTNLRTAFGLEDKKIEDAKTDQNVAHHQ
jgi:hypothetical protein